VGERVKYLPSTSVYEREKKSQNSSLSHSAVSVKHFHCTRARAELSYNHGPLKGPFPEIVAVTATLSTVSFSRCEVGMSAVVMEHLFCSNMAEHGGYFILTFPNLETLELQIEIGGSRVNGFMIY